MMTLEQAKKVKPRTKINATEQLNLDRIAKFLFDLGPEKGWLVLASQWAKNPILSHFLVPVIKRGVTSTEGFMLHVAINKDFDRPYVEIMSKAVPEDKDLPALWEFPAIIE